MGVTLKMSAFRSHLKGRTISVRTARADSRLAGVGVDKADLDGDGTVSTKAELNALFKRIDQFDRDGKTGSLQVRDRSGKATRVSDMIQAVGELAGVNILQKLAQNDILLVGLNEDNKHEAAALRKKGNAVVFIKDQDDDSITINGTRFDLTVASELEAFVDLLGLPEAQEKAIVSAIQSGGQDIKDELASIAWVWADAENGRGIPGRLVLSGHSVGDTIWGDGNGRLIRSTVAKLARAMPRAAGQVEDLHLAACYCGGEDDLKQWLLIFPKVKTIWAYAGSAPGSKEGAVPHLHLWDRATRGDKDSINRLIARKTRKGENVAVWTRRHGYMDGSPPDDISRLKAAITAAEPTFTAYFKGDRTVANTQTGELRELYDDIQALLRHPDLPAAERPLVKKKRDVTIRLIYYDKSVKKNFAANRAALITAGYRALGLAPVDFAQLSRKDALKAIQDFLGALAKNTGAGDAQKLRPHLESGLRDLSESHIPENWI